MKRDFLLCLSFSNLVFLNAWDRVLWAGAGYYRQNVAKDILLVACCVVLFTIVSWLLLLVVRRSKNARVLNIARFGFFCFAALWLLPYVFRAFSALPPLGKLTLGICLAVLPLLWKRIPLSRFAASLLLCSSLFVLVTFAEATWFVSQSAKPQSQIKPDVVRNSGKSRVLWIVFDELDEDIAFDNRPKSLHLPEFDALQAHSWAASRAYPPANLTELSIPALLTGKIIENTKPLNDHELSLQLGDSHVWIQWSKAPSIVSDARNLGFRTSLIGWYHPYCDVLGSELDYCFQVKSAAFFGSLVRQSFAGTTASVLRRVFPILGSLGTPDPEDRRCRRDHLREYMEIENAAIAAVSRFQDGLLIIHIPAPHPTAIFDRDLGQYRTEGKRSYLDNLALADMALGEIRKQMEVRDTWGDTTVIVTSDHWWRVRAWAKGALWTEEERVFDQKRDHRVPFLVKLAGQKTQINYDRPVSTILIRDLIRSVLTGETESAEALSAKVNSLTTETPRTIYRDYETQRVTVLRAGD
ncbi:MAG: sulfatase-like hydrolase/transferase [Terriglobia bacterium]|nr:sulfatase-like hydrolase/transferase [Terriglobia bacterium]